MHRVNCQEKAKQKIKRRVKKMKPEDVAKIEVVTVKNLSFLAMVMAKEKKGFILSNSMQIDGVLTDDNIKNYIKADFLDDLEVVNVDGNSSVTRRKLKPEDIVSFNNAIAVMKIAELRAIPKIVVAEFDSLI